MQMRQNAEPASPLTTGVLGNLIFHTQWDLKRGRNEQGATSLKTTGLKHAFLKNQSYAMQISKCTKDSPDFRFFNSPRHIVL